MLAPEEDLFSSERKVHGTNIFYFYFYFICFCFCFPVVRISLSFLLFYFMKVRNGFFLLRTFVYNYLLESILPGFSYKSSRNLTLTLGLGYLWFCGTVSGEYSSNPPPRGYIYKPHACLVTFPFRQGKHLEEKRRDRKLKQKMPFGKFCFARRFGYLDHAFGVSYTFQLFLVCVFQFERS